MTDTPDALLGASIARTARPMRSIDDVKPADTSDALLPCPVCGEQPHKNGGTARGAYGFRCMKPDHLLQSYGRTYAEAVAAWNRRAPSPEIAPDALLEAVAEVFELALERHGVPSGIMEGTLDDALAALAILRPEIDRARAEGFAAGREWALEAWQRFMRHDGLCGIIGGYDRCTCGLDDAIARGDWRTTVAAAKGDGA